MNRASVAVILVSLATIGLGACGGGGAASTDTVAQVAAVPITKAAVSHWMSTLAGGDYYQLSQEHTVPDGLVADPPNYSRCVGQLRAGAARVHSPGSKPKAAALEAVCRQLYQALKAQATEYLVNAAWMTGLDRELGITASDAETMRLYRRVAAKQFPSAVAHQQYFAARRLTMPDELLILRLDVLGQKVLARYHANPKEARAAFGAAERRWTAKTSCRVGYVVEHCKQFTGTPAVPGPSAAVLMEQVASLVAGVCVNNEVCGKRQ